MSHYLSGMQGLVGTWLLAAGYYRALQQPHPLFKLGCHAPASLAGYRCSRCSWPLCGPQCETRPLHTAECKVFAVAGVKPTQLRLELQTKVRDDFTEKASTRALSLLKAPASAFTFKTLC